MTNKKTSIIVAVAIVATASTLYGIYEVSPPTITLVSGGAQYVDRTFEEDVEIVGIIVEGQITDVQTKIFTEEVMETDENGDQVVFETLQVPRNQITIKIQEILKDNYGLTSKTVVVYDHAVSNAIGKVNGEKARFVYHDAYDYHVGEKGIFLIENDSELWLHGFTSFYPVKEGKSTIESEFGKKYGRTPVELEHAKDVARLGAED